MRFARIVRADRTTVQSQLREVGVGTDRVEVLVLGGPLGDSAVGAGEGDPEVLDRLAGAPGERVVAGELIVEARVVGVVLEALVQRRDAAVVVAGEVIGLGGVPVLVGGGRKSGAGLAAEDEDRRLGLERRRLAPLADVGADQGAGRRVELLALDLEAGGAGDHHVELLVAGGPLARLVVRLDHLVAGGGSGVGVGADAGQAHRAADRPPDRARALLERRQLVEMDDPFAHGTTS